MIDLDFVNTIMQAKIATDMVVEANKLIVKCGPEAIRDTVLMDGGAEIILMNINAMTEILSDLMTQHIALAEELMEIHDILDEPTK